MDKFYFASSNGTVRDFDGELYHGIGGWFKKDAKYIKREWKNGKWIYTYPDDKKKISDKKLTKDEGKRSYKGFNLLDKVRETVGNILKSTSKTLDRLADKASSAANAVLSKIANKKLPDTNPATVERGRAAVGELLKRTMQDIKDSAAAIGNIMHANKKTDAGSPEEDMAAVNPLRGTPCDVSHRYSYNDLNCVLAYELRRRGYDVEAMPFTRADDETHPLTRLQKALTSLTAADSPELYSFRTDLFVNEEKSKELGHTYLDADQKKLLDETKQYVDSLPNDSRTIVYDNYNATFVVLEKANGEAIVRDVVNNNSYSYDDWVLNYAFNELRFVRTDNLKLNNDQVGRRVRNRQ